jgi:hypothetical protein
MIPFSQLLTNLDEIRASGEVNYFDVVLLGALGQV